MAKPKSLIDKDIPVTFNVSHVVVTDYIKSAIRNEVAKAIERAVADSVSDAVEAIVEKIGRERVGKEIDRVLAEGWPVTNEYGEAKGTNLTLKDRIGKILNMQDRYGSSQRWLDERVKAQVQETLNKDLKADIQAARDKFKTEVDAVLTATIREALAKNLGLR
jgi:hypothetical protein